MKKIFIALVCVVSLVSCTNPQPVGEKYRIKKIELVSVEPYQDYWEKHMGIQNNSQKKICTYDVVLSNERQDTVITTSQRIEISPNQWIGKEVFVKDGRIL